MSGVLKLQTIDLNLTEDVNLLAGNTLSVELYARNTCFGKTHNSGTARLWSNDGQANSMFDATVGGASPPYYLRDGSVLSNSAGSGPKKTIDVFVDNKIACPDRAFNLLGSWIITLP